MIGPFPNFPRDVAKWRHVATVLRDAITRGDFPPGTRLPTEPELADAFPSPVDRHTLRRGLNVLAAWGLARSEPGKGWWVTRVHIVDRDPVADALAAHAALTDAPSAARDGAYGDDATDHVLTTWHDDTATAQLADDLDIPVGAPLIHRRIHIFLDDTPHEITHSWIPVAIVRATAAVLADTHGDHDTQRILADADVLTTNYDGWIEARLPSIAEATDLHIAETQPVLAQRTRHVAGARVVEVAQTVTRGTELRVRFAVDLTTGTPEGKP